MVAKPRSSNGRWRMRSSASSMLVSPARTPSSSALRFSRSIPAPVAPLKADGLALLQTVAGGLAGGQLQHEHRRLVAAVGGARLGRPRAGRHAGGDLDDL